MILTNIPDLEAKNRTFEGGDKPLDRDYFQFLAQIGSGAFGKVYRASSKKTDKQYAIKILTKAQVVNLKLTDQLRNEITILAKCDHPNIIKLYGAFEDQNFVSLILELANGGSLFKRLQSFKRFSENMAAQVLGDVIRAIVYLHSLIPPVLHRDLKPENVLLVDQQFKIADFGWSNIDDEFRNTFCGTPDYLAPEMIKGEGHNEKLDVWTIGVLLYELLHGRPPFSPKEKVADKRMAQKAIEKNILEGKIEFDPTISKEAIACIRTLMNPDSRLRPTAREIFELELLKKYEIRLDGKFNKHMNFQASVESSDAAQMKNLILEYRDKLQKISLVNESMREMIKSKDKQIEVMQKENELLNQKLKSVSSNDKTQDSSKRDAEIHSLES